MKASVRYFFSPLWTHLSEIVFQEAQSYADDNSLLFMETSAKTSMNVNEIFMAIGKGFLLYSSYESYKTNV